LLNLHSLNLQWPAHSKRLEDHLLNRQQNNFNLIRLVSALLVIIAHGNQPLDPFNRLSHGIVSCNEIAMPAFFFLSGLLVSQSLDHTPSRLNFCWRRFLRLYPAAFIVIIVSACLLGPIVSTYPPSAYFSHPLFRQYLRTILLVRIYFDLPGVFLHSVIGPSVNASLWSLSLEIKLYACLFLFSYIKNKRLYNSLIIILIILLFSIGAFFRVPVETAIRQSGNPGFVLHPYSNLTVYFLIGILCYRFRARLSITNWWIILFLSIGLLSLRLHILDQTAFLLLPGTILYAAVTGTRWVRKITPAPDLSYGIYLWGFPVVQVVLNELHPSTPLATLLLTTLITILLALLSWYLVESRALKAKNWVK
jgi:peptidoglycan/LPS O-acetylase OafA/YrhL